MTKIKNSKKSMSVAVPGRPCEDCAGSGISEQNPNLPCEACDGTGIDGGKR